MGIDRPRHLRRIHLPLVLSIANVAGLSCSAGKDSSNEIVVASVARCTAARAPPVAGDLPFEGRRKEFFSQYPIAELQYGGGRVLKSPRIVGVFIGADGMQHPTEALMESYGCTSYWRDAVNEYGVGDALYARTVNLPEVPGMGDAGMSVQDFQGWIIDAVAANTFGNLTEESVLVFFLPPTVLLRGEDCTTVGGGHESILTRDNRRIAYAFINACSPSHGPQDLIERVHAVTHELIEIATDPDPATAPAWRALGAGVVAPTVRLPQLAVDNESCDLCDNIPAQPPDYPFSVANGYSNRLARAGRDPCHSPLGLKALAVVRSSGPQPAPIDLSSGGAVALLDVFSEDPSATYTLRVFASLFAGGFVPVPLLLSPIFSVRDGDAVPVVLHLSLSASFAMAIETMPHEFVAELCESDAGTAAPCSESRDPITALPPRIEPADAGAQDGANEGDIEGGGTESG